MKKFAYTSLVLLLAACSQSDQPKSDQYPGFVQIGTDRETSHLFVDMDSVKRDANGNVTFKQLRVLDSGSYAIQDAVTNCRDTYKGLAGTKFTKDGVRDADYPADSSFNAYREQPALSALVNKACEKAEESRVIVGTFDDIKALELVYGPYHPELKGAYWTTINPPAGLNQSASEFSGKDGVVQIVFSEEYTEGKDTKHIIFTQTQLTDGSNDCHPCGPLLGAIVFVRVGDKWRIESDNRYLDIMGVYGAPPELSWINLGKNTHAISAKLTDMHQGVISAYMSIYTLKAVGWNQILESLDESETISDLHLNLNNSNPEQNYAEATVVLNFDDEGKKSVVEKKYSFDGNRYQLNNPTPHTTIDSHAATSNINTSRPIPENSSTSADQIPVPGHVVGDTYITEVINLADNKPGIKTERKVVYSDATKMVVESKSLSSKKGTVRVLDYTPEWNLVRSRNPDGSGLDYAPALKYYDFPLSTGKKWQQTSIETDIKTGAQRKHTLSSEVLGRERVTVPAGTFNAIKLITKSELVDLAKGETTFGSDTSWYVPEIRRSVKSETASRKPDGTEDRQIIQLIEYKLGNAEDIKGD
ncbi:hypothetical protein [Methylomonas fluvii]|uniref:Lipoprotein n=1 Tax=Methylomonas fluvii TaxID=1854564 RepID=A0ABR9DF80_9GAMM|nr:hypothetical protein [Methylomonas fluvii]MBD9361744.1 hypothetical protein [Methylomonas fluvii]